MSMEALQPQSPDPRPAMPPLAHNWAAETLTPEQVETMLANVEAHRARCAYLREQWAAKKDQYNEQRRQAPASPRRGPVLERVSLGMVREETPDAEEENTLQENDLSRLLIWRRTLRNSAT